MSISLNKLNKPGMNTSFGTNKTGSTSQAAKNMANYSGATNGSSIFKLNASHGSNWVPGVQVTPNQSKHNYQRVRQNLNSRGFAPGGTIGLGARNYGYTGVQSFQASQGMNGFQKAMMIGELVNGTFGMLNNIFGADKTQQAQQTPQNEAREALNQAANSNTIQTSTTLTGQLSGANSFNNVKSMETKVAQDKSNLNNDYKNLSQKTTADSILQGTNVQDGLDAAKVQIDTSSLDVKATFSGDYDKFMQDIDTDVNNIANLKTTTLPQAKNAVTQALGQTTQAITTKTEQVGVKNSELKTLEGQLATAPADQKTAIQSKINQLKGEIKKLEEDITGLKEKETNLKAAESAIDQLSDTAQEAIDSLKEKKVQVKDMRDFESKVKDKKYDLAKTQDKELKKVMDKIAKLNKEISNLKDKNTSKYNKSDDKREAKYDTLMSERATAYGELNRLTASLTAAGETSFKNSKGSVYTLTNLTKAQNMGTPA